MNAIKEKNLAFSKLKKITNFPFFYKKKHLWHYVNKPAFKGLQL